MTPDLTRLRALCQAATPGPWTAKHDDRGSWLSAAWPEAPDGSRRKYLAQFDYAYNPKDEEDAAYIAAVSPSVMIALLDQLAALTEARDSLADIADEWIGFRVPSLDTFADVATTTIAELRKAGR